MPADDSSRSVLLSEQDARTLLLLLIHAESELRIADAASARWLVPLYQRLRPYHVVAGTEPDAGELADALLHLNHRLRRAMGEEW